MKHRIYLSSNPSVRVTREDKTFLRNTVIHALDCLCLKSPCEINIRLTDPNEIRALNNSYRGIDSETDVLSFPMFDFLPGELPSEEQEDPNTGCIPLGDMAINMARAEQQAQEYGHSRSRELGYLAVHSCLHLLGYDHEKPDDQKRMRKQEEFILESIGLGRENQEGNTR